MFLRSGSPSFPTPTSTCAPPSVPTPGSDPSSSRLDFFSALGGGRRCHNYRSTPRTSHCGRHDRSFCTSLRGRIAECRHLHGPSPPHDHPVNFWVPGSSTRRGSGVGSREYGGYSFGYCPTGGRTTIHHRLIGWCGGRPGLSCRDLGDFHRYPRSGGSLAYLLWTCRTLARRPPGTPRPVPGPGPGPHPSPPRSVGVELNRDLRCRLRDVHRDLPPALHPQPCPAHGGSLLRVVPVPEAPVTVHALRVEGPVVWVDDEYDPGGYCFWVTVEQRVVRAVDEGVGCRGGVSAHAHVLVVSVRRLRSSIVGEVEGCVPGVQVSDDVKVVQGARRKVFSGPPGQFPVVLGGRGLGCRRRRVCGKCPQGHGRRGATSWCASRWRSWRSMSWSPYPCRTPARL